MAKRKRSPQVQARRTATVIVPEGLTVPPLLDVPEVIPELPSPHVYQGTHLISTRRHLRAHHRLVLDPDPSIRYYQRRVQIPVVTRPFEPFMSSWYMRAGNVYIIHHFNPEAKIDQDTHTRMRDFKHPGRADSDHSRAAVLRAVPFRNPAYSTGLYGAFMRGSHPGIASDTAIAVWNSIGRP